MNTRDVLAFSTIPLALLASAWLIDGYALWSRLANVTLPWLWLGPGRGDADSWGHLCGHAVRSRGYPTRSGSCRYRRHADLVRRWNCYRFQLILGGIRAAACEP